MWKNTRNVFYKMRAVRNTCSKGNIDHSKCALGEAHKIHVYILRSKCVKTPEMFSIKRVPFVIRTHVESQQQTRYMRIFFVLNVEKHQKCFLKTCAARNTVSKGNMDRSNSALAATDKIYVYILRSKCRKTPEMFSIQRVPLIILSRKEISIVAIVRWQQQTRYMCIFSVLNVDKPQKCFL